MYVYGKRKRIEKKTSCQKSHPSGWGRIERVVSSRRKSLSWIVLYCSVNTAKLQTIPLPKSQTQTENENPNYSFFLTLLFQVGGGFPTFGLNNLRPNVRSGQDLGQHFLPDPWPVKTFCKLASWFLGWVCSQTTNAQKLTLSNPAGFVSYD